MKYEAAASRVKKRRRHQGHDVRYSSYQGLLKPLYHLLYPYNCKWHEWSSGHEERMKSLAHCHNWVSGRLSWRCLRCRCSNKRKTCCAEWIFSEQKSVMKLCRLCLKITKNVSLFNITFWWKLISVKSKHSSLRSQCFLKWDFLDDFQPLWL